MDAVFSNFDDYLKAFGLTIELFVVSGIASLVWGTVLAAFRVGPVSVLNRPQRSTSRSSATRRC